MKKLLRLTLFLLLSTKAVYPLFAQSLPDKKIDSLKNVLKTAVEDTNKVNLFREMGTVYYNRGNYTDALTSFNSSLDLAKTIGYKKGEASAYGNIGLALENQGNFPEASKFHLNAIKIAEDLGEKAIVANANHNLGNINSRQGNYTEALNYYFLALKIREEMKNKDGIASSYGSIGLIYMDLKNLSEALNYQLKALSIHLEIGNKHRLIRDYVNIGLIYYMRSSYADALNNYNIALDISKEIGDKGGEMIALGNMGSLKSKLGNYQEALKYYKDCLAISEQIGAKYSISLNNINIADVYNNIAKKTSTIQDSSGITIENYNKAIQYSNKGLVLAKEIVAKEWIRIAYVNLSDSYRGLGDYKKALEYADLSRQLKDSLLNSETTRKIDQLKTNYEVEKAVIAEKAKQEQAKTELQFAFLKREDSLKYQQELTKASLDLSNKQNELNKLAFLKSQAELEAEQSRSIEKGQRLALLEKERKLQSNKLVLQKTQLDLKESQINSEKRQKLFYAGGILLTIILFGFIYSNIKTRVQSDRMVAEQRLKSEKSEAAHKMAELELQSLRAQLNPHFMFNSLNAIQELILREDIDNSHLYLSRFSELLRTLLDNSNQPFVSLGKELNLLELYLSLEKLRICDLAYTIHIDPSIDCDQAMIPNMILQPYIENAIWHGLSHKKSERRLDIRIFPIENGITCEVQDNGVGRKMASELKSSYRKQHRSKGMELLSKRFTLLSKEYGSDIITEVQDLHQNGVATGTLVSINIPSQFVNHLQPVLA
jgi:tetratricopeptide (TPR) repeat protein